MKRLCLLNSLILCLGIIINFYGCMNQPIDLKSESPFDAKSNESNNATENDTNYDSETDIKTDTILSTDEVISKLEKGETVYYNSLNKTGEETFAIFARDSIPRVIKTFTSYEDLQRYVFEAQIAEQSKSRYRSLSDDTAAYYIELDNGNYCALALCSDRKTVFNKDGSVLFIEGTIYPQTEKDESISPVVFALIEKGGYDIEAKNPASNTEDAEKKQVSLSEAAEALNTGRSVRLCDIVLPADAKLFASALFADPMTGEQCKDNNGMIILDEFSAKKFDNSADGQVLAVEIGVKYDENGYGKKAMIYAFLPAEALADCVKVNAETMTESAFVQKYSEKSAVYKITEYRNDRVAFYNESITNDRTYSFGEIK